MPTNKHAAIRYKVIDECLRNPGLNCTWQLLSEKCSETIEDHTGRDTNISRRTIYNDISFMESEAGFSAPIIREKNGRVVYFKYEDKDFSINNQPLNREELDKLKDMVQLMSRISGTEEFEWVQEILPKLEAANTDNLNVDKIISYESNIDLKNLDLLTPLFNAIRYKKVLEVIYHPYKEDEPRIHIVHPHFLKQFNNRWFLFSLVPEVKKAKNIHPFNMALDRIRSIKVIKGRYIPNKDIDYEAYFEDIIGVTHIEKEKPIQIKLKIDALQAKYIDSKPIHESQKKIRFEEGATHYTTTLKIKPNEELYRKLLSFGSRVEVISPAKVRKEIAERAKAMHQLYSN